MERFLLGSHSCTTHNLPSQYRETQPGRGVWSHSKHLSVLSRAPGPSSEQRCCSRDLLGCWGCSGRTVRGKTTAPPKRGTAQSHNRNKPNCRNTRLHFPVNTKSSSCRFKLRPTHRPDLERAGRTGKTHPSPSWFHPTATQLRFPVQIPVLRFSTTQRTQPTARDKLIHG